MKRNILIHTHSILFSSCFPQGESAHFGVLLPVVLILAVNFTLFFIILVKFTRTKRPIGKSEENNNLRQVRIGLSISVLLGLSWILAIFAVKDAEYTFQLLFCIFNSLQGFFIFVLYALTSEIVRKELVKSWIFFKIGKRGSYTLQSIPSESLRSTDDRVSLLNSLPN